MDRRVRLTGAVAAAALLAATSGLAFGQAGAGTAQTIAGSGSSSSGLSKSDRTFMMKAAQGGIAEVEMGRLAAQKSQDPQIRAFGNRMVQDHSQANDKLMQVAQTLNVELPTAADKKDQTQLEKLQGLSGGSFDRAYAPDMVKDHKKDIAEFEREAKNVRNPALKAWVQETLPVLKEHLQLAEALPAQRSRAAEAGTSGTTPR